MCSDCEVLLVEEVAPDRAPGEHSTPALNPQSAVLVTGRRSEADLALSFLKAHGIEAQVWSTGLSPWSMAGSLPEMTGIASEFGSHRVMVADPEADAARDLLAEISSDEDPASSMENVEENEAPRTFLEALRNRWALTAFAIVLLVIILLVGTPGY
ncbi:MAG: hypothetical protein M3198_13105 [Actinomycetota bacterium]|nr:hypothetical protein [Actinomycetota bacterium]